MTRQDDPVAVPRLIRRRDRPGHHRDADHDRGDPVRGADVTSIEALRTELAYLTETGKVERADQVRAAIAALEAPTSPEVSSAREAIDDDPEAATVDGGAAAVDDGSASAAGEDQADVKPAKAKRGS